MPTVTIQQAFALALQHHKAGGLAEAEALYRQVLAVQPNHAEAWHHLGVIARRVGRNDLAVGLIRQAIAINAHNPTAHSNLGVALADQGQFDEAVSAYRRALQLRPDYPEAHRNLGVALADQGRFDEAVSAYRRALQLRPDYPEAHLNLGIALEDQGQIEEAIAAYRRAIELQPGYPEAHLNLGNALKEQGRLEEAVAAYRQALLLKPDFAGACNNLGLAQRERGGFDEAVTAYRRAIELQPDYPEAHLNLGSALSERGQFDEAAAACRRAIEIKPDYAEAYNNLGNALKGEGNLEQAFAAYRQGLALRPDHAVMHSNLIFALHFHPDEDTSTIAEEQARWNRQFCEPLKRCIRPQANDRHPERRLRVGYVSSDFRSHPVSFFLVPLLEAHDHRSFEIYCYASVCWPDAVTQRLRQSADVWREVRALSDAQLAERVRDDGIDILIDLAMHTEGNLLKVFARQPAPVQVSWLAYPGTTGMATIDYRLTDAHIDPAGWEEDGAGGQAVRLPDAWCCYTPIEEFPPVSPPPAMEKKHVTFGSLNQFGKLPARLLHSWARLLGTVPESRLLMVCPEGSARERTQALFAAHGIARDRVEWVAPCRPWPDYTQLFASIDLALDAYPCNGMTTTCHTLWMGVPVVTRMGTTAVSRAGSSLLHTIGLPELVASSENEYVAIAAQLAQDLPRLTAVRATLRPRMQASPLMDASLFAQNTEAAYRAMWQRWCAQPQS